MEDIKFRLKRIVIWLSRCLRTRGFGVQSPWAYQFIRYVINEHYPYYAYEKFPFLKGGKSLYRRMMGGLYFRLANYRQPSVVWESSTSDSFADYFRLGCKRVKVLTDHNARNETPQLVRMAANENHSFYEEVCQRADEKTILVIEGISDTHNQKCFWNKVQHDNRTGVTFDLYYCGIVFFDKSLYKHHYIVNF